MAPVTGMPPKSGTVILAKPWPISSVFELVREPVTPSATVAESRDSIAPNIAMVNADGSSKLTDAMLNPIACGAGSEPSIEPKRSPIVCTPVTPKYSRAT